MDKRASLRLQFKRLLEKERLDDRQYALLRRKLENSGADVSGVDTYPDGRFQRKRTIWTAAAMILVLIASFTAIRFNSMTDVESDVPQRIAEEVAINHIKFKNPDFETSSMEEVRVFFDRLDFVPAGSDHIDRTSHFLRGARYCTLQGKIAAHLMFGSPQGDSVSYYQVAYDPIRFGPLPDIEKDEEPRVFIRRGVEIKIWVERNLVMARARTTPLQS
ncbi:MAG: hypothetical protein WD097_09290 [Balneolales bacterium]